MKKSEEKKKLVEELAQLHRELNVTKLHDFPDHKTSKDWLANVSAVLKQLDEGDYQRFQDLQTGFYSDIADRGYRIKAAQEMDRFVRQKVAEYEKYDFSYMDRKNNDSTKGPIGILNRGKRNIFVNNRFIGKFAVGIQDEGEDSLAVGNKLDVGRKSKGKWYQTWWGQLIIGLLVTIVGGLILGLIL